MTTTDIRISYFPGVKSSSRYVLSLETGDVTISESQLHDARDRYFWYNSDHTGQLYMVLENRISVKALTHVGEDQQERLCTRYRLHQLFERRGWSRRWEGARWQRATDRRILSEIRAEFVEKEGPVFSLVYRRPSGY